MYQNAHPFKGRLCIILLSSFLHLGDYNILVPTRGCCLVSFTDTENNSHAVEVSATTLYEAAVLAMAEFRRCRFTANAPGPATRLIVKVQAPSTSHEVLWEKIEALLRGAGKPNKQAMKGRLRELLGL
jgi:hypothetical protein